MYYFKGSPTTYISTTVNPWMPRDVTCIKLIDLWKSPSLRIVNWRILLLVSKRFVRRKFVWLSIFFFINERQFSLINGFITEPFNELSNHAPLRFSLL